MIEKTPSLLLIAFAVNAQLLELENISLDVLSTNQPALQASLSCWVFGL